MSLIFYSLSVCIPTEVSRIQPEKNGPLRTRRRIRGFTETALPSGGRPAFRQGPESEY